jgi:hypothetical protein
LLRRYFRRFYWFFGPFSTLSCREMKPKFKNLQTILRRGRAFPAAGMALGRT